MSHNFLPPPPSASLCRHAHDPVTPAVPAKLWFSPVRNASRSSLPSLVLHTTPLHTTPRRHKIRYACLLCSGTPSSCGRRSLRYRSCRSNILPVSAGTQTAVTRPKARDPQDGFSALFSEGRSLHTHDGFLTEASSVADVQASRCCFLASSLQTATPVTPTSPTHSPQIQPPYTCVERGLKKLLKVLLETRRRHFERCRLEGSQIL